MENQPTVSVRPLARADLPTVVEIHLASFPGFFLSFLGPGFLATYYRSVLDFGQIADGVGVDGRIIGFVVGIDNGFGFYRKLLRRRLHRFAPAAAAALIRRPSILFRLIRALNKRGPPDEGRRPSMTLTSIAVLPEFHGIGAGTALTDAFLEHARSRGFRSVSLETDARENDRVNAFYVKQGFRLGRSYATAEGRWMNEYYIDL